MILQTGGLLFGEISTRSMPASMAILMAVTVSMVPLLEPYTSISWICALRMSSLMRGPSLATAGGALLGRRMGGSPRLLKGRRYFEARRGCGQANSLTSRAKTIKGAAFWPRRAHRAPPVTPQAHGTDSRREPVSLTD